MKSALRKSSLAASSHKSYYIKLKKVIREPKVQETKWKILLRCVGERPQTAPGTLYTNYSVYSFGLWVGKWWKAQCKVSIVTEKRINAEFGAHSCFLAPIRCSTSISVDSWLSSSTPWHRKPTSLFFASRWGCSFYAEVGSIIMCFLFLDLICVLDAHEGSIQQSMRHDFQILTLASENWYLQCNRVLYKIVKVISGIQH